MKKKKKTFLVLHWAKLTQLNLMLEEKHTYSYADLWEKEGEVRVCDTRSGKDK